MEILGGQSNIGDKSLVWVIKEAALDAESG
jgi:hypothetical protein